jgi:hypothetical protein
MNVNVEINNSSFESKSFFNGLFKLIEHPEVIGHQDLKNKVGTIKYRIIKKIIEISNEKSIKKVKNSISAIKNNDPGKPKNINKFIRIRINSFVFRRPSEFISVTNLVL